MSQNKRTVIVVGNLETALKYEVIANGTLKLIARSTMNVNEREISIRIVQILHLKWRNGEKFFPVRRVNFY